MNLVRLLSAILFAFFLLSCSGDGILRGYEEDSDDNKTYLIIENGNCEQYFIDDVLWNHSIGEIGEIDFGFHCLSCGTKGNSEYAGTCFEVKEKTVFHFDYWGP